MSDSTLSALKKLQDELLADYDETKPCLTVCAGSGCCASGALEVYDALQKAITDSGMDAKVVLKKTGCRGFCEQGPLVMLLPTKTLYVKVKAANANDIVTKTLGEGQVIETLLYKDPASGSRIANEEDIPFYKEQTRVLTKNSPYIDPESLADYIRLGGYQALCKAIAMKPEEIIAEVKDSGLRGRGGAGFPTGLKWRMCFDTPSETKYIVVNCDEGDPGSFHDQSLMAANPFSILEGVIIGAYTLGVKKAYIYVRYEYTQAVEKINKAVKTAYDQGLLGKNILGSGIDLDVVVQLAASAFVSGEETGILNAIEGKVPEPRKRPYFPARSGLWGKPTVVSNVKTWASIPYIINNGAAWYKGLGTEKSGGTTIVSIVGDVKNPGFAEVKIGTSLRDIIEKIGGGKKKRELKAVQTGGPAGAYIPVSKWDIPFDYEPLKEAGSMFGSVLEARSVNTCMVQKTIKSLEFSIDESCGHCTSCREGIPAMLDLLYDIADGDGYEDDLDTLNDIALTVRDGSMCNLGRTASMIVLAAIDDYRDEFLSHIEKGKCPGGGCKELITYVIDPDKCRACGTCQRGCPVKAISGEQKEKRSIDPKICIRCSSCYNACPFDAIRYE